jgi:hypothetical protein
MNWMFGASLKNARDGLDILLDRFSLLKMLTPWVLGVEKISMCLMVNKNIISLITLSLRKFVIGISKLHRNYRQN